MVVTIDGPVASGKSTIAAKLARRIGFFHFSSGLLYRAIGYLLVVYSRYSREGLYEADKNDIDYYLNPDRLICFFDTDGIFHISWKGTDVVPLLKDKKIDQCASIISTNVYVRERMLVVQRSLGEAYNLVVDGRDSGSVVFPDALVKFYLTATVEVRARRWKQAQEALGNSVSSDEAMKEIQLRDDRDRGRTVAPLIIPEGAIIIDNSTISVNQTVEKMVVYCRNRLKNQ